MCVLKQVGAWSKKTCRRHKQILISNLVIIQTIRFLDQRLLSNIGAEQNCSLGGLCDSRSICVDFNLAVSVSMRK